ncbi:MAG: hypothetical protein AAF587_10650 [Bacteroidota bacterium]
MNISQTYPVYHESSSKNIANQWVEFSDFAPNSSQPTAVHIPILEEIADTIYNSWNFYNVHHWKQIRPVTSIYLNGYAQQEEMGTHKLLGKKRVEAIVSLLLKIFQRKGYSRSLWKSISFNPANFGAQTHSAADGRIRQNNKRVELFLKELNPVKYLYSLTRISLMILDKPDDYEINKRFWSPFTTREKVPEFSLLTHSQLSEMECFIRKIRLRNVDDRYIYWPNSTSKHKGPINRNTVKSFRLELLRKVLNLDYSVKQKKLSESQAIYASIYQMREEMKRGISSMTIAYEQDGNGVSRNIRKKRYLIVSAARNPNSIYSCIKGLKI